MRVALCQLNPTIGDLDGNAAKVRAFAERAQRSGAQLAIFSELVLCGYPPRDWLERPGFIAANRRCLDKLAEALPAEMTALVGFADASSSGQGRPARNAVAIVSDGRVQQVVHKMLLPSYDVFDEDRYFEPGNEAQVVELHGWRLGLTICEDIWGHHQPSRLYSCDPVAQLMQQGVDALINIAASPFALPKVHQRAEMLAAIAQRHHRPVMFVNQAGGNDDLLFDGASGVVDGGRWLINLPTFVEGMAILELTVGQPPRVVATELEADSLPHHSLAHHSLAQPGDDTALLLRALACGVRDFVGKCGVGGVVVGLSGGIDSAVTAAIAVWALGPERVLGIAMPTRFSSPDSLYDARELAANLGVRFIVVDIEPIFAGSLETLRAPIDALAAPHAEDVTWENLQARLRGATLMAAANRLGWLMLCTGNKSEVAVGYSTLYGDLAGGFAVLSDVWKTTVYQLAAELNRQAGKPCIPQRTLTRAPSAELRPNQTDQDALPPYEQLDAILRRHVEDGLEATQLIALGFAGEVVHDLLARLARSEFKRRQMPPGPIVSSKAFGPGRRYPIAGAMTTKFCSPDVDAPR